MRTNRIALFIFLAVCTAIVCFRKHQSSFDENQKISDSSDGQGQWEKYTNDNSTDSPLPMDNPTTEELWTCLENDDSNRLEYYLLNGLSANALLLSKRWSFRRGDKRFYMEPILIESIKCKAIHCAEVLLDHGADVLLAGTGESLSIQFALQFADTDLVSRLVSLSPKMSEIQTKEDISNLIQRIRPFDCYLFPTSQVKSFLTIPCDELSYSKQHGLFCECWNSIPSEQYPVCLLHFTTNGPVFHYKYHWMDAPNKPLLARYPHLSAGIIIPALGVPACLFPGIYGIDF